MPVRRGAAAVITRRYTYTHTLLCLDTPAYPTLDVQSAAEWIKSCRWFERAPHVNLDGMCQSHTGSRRNAAPRRMGGTRGIAGLQSYLPSVLLRGESTVDLELTCGLPGPVFCNKIRAWGGRGRESRLTGPHGKFGAAMHPRRPTRSISTPVSRRNTSNKVAFVAFGRRKKWTSINNQY